MDNMDTIKAISERQRERGALALECYAAELRNADSDDMRRIGRNVAELAAIIMREYADMAARAEYYECPSCQSDFHGPLERGGQECREYRHAAIVDGIHTAIRAAN